MAARLARRHHANIVAVARRKERLDALKRELESSSGARVDTCVADLADLHSVDRVIAYATKDRPLVGAILNAGVTHFGRHDELRWTDFEAMLDTNVRGVVRMVTELIPPLEKDPQGGGLLLRDRWGSALARARPHRLCRPGTRTRPGASGARHGKAGGRVPRPARQGDGARKAEPAATK